MTRANLACSSDLHVPLRERTEMLVAFLLEFVRFNGRQFPLARDRSIHWSMCINHEPIEGRMT
jgi:hypothetical protein